jgi:hypothetical protein
MSIIHTALIVLLMAEGVSAADLAPPGATTPFTYVSGPTNCTRTAGYPDPEICVIPGETPLATFSVPQPGATYIDRNFGSTVKLLTGFGANHGYATPSAFSATGKYVAVAVKDVQVNVVETATGRMLFTGRPGSVTGDTIRWDAIDDDVYYALGGSQVRRHKLSTNTTTLLVDYATDGHRFTGISGGGTGDTSKDNWLGFWAATQHQVCAIDLKSAKTYCADYLASSVVSKVGIANVDFVNVSKGVDSRTGKRYVLLMSNPAIAVFSVNTTTGALDFEFRGPELPADFQVSKSGNSNGVCETGETCFGSYHSDTFEDSDGQQYITFVGDLETPCQRSVVTAQIGKGLLMLKPLSLGGGRTDAMLLHLCGGGPTELWADNHTGCAKNAAYCVVSTNYTLSRNPADLVTSINRTSHLSELIVMRGNGAEIRRVAQTRSIQFGNDWYWSTARASISADGTQIAWDSNFGYPNRGQAVAMADTGFGRVASSQCDLNQDGHTTVSDVQLVINQALGLSPCGTGDLAGDGKCGIVDIQRVINAALGHTCKVGL